MRVSVFGLGYVGCVTSACLARDGFDVVGVDVSANKVAEIQAGETPVSEPGLAALVRGLVAAGRLRASQDAEAAVATSDLSLVCVGTPVDQSGELDLSHVFGVMREIGRATASKSRAHVVVLRSTVPPGTTDRCAALLSEAAGGRAVSIAFNPEFLREGSAIHDYESPPFVVIGTEDKAAENAVRVLYASVPGQVLVTQPNVAEMLKLVCNAWHATKVTFANEVGRIAKAHGADGREVMRLMVQDDKLNTSATYLRPGHAFGGSCLPKDLSALIQLARAKKVAVPMLDAVPASNGEQVDQIVRAVLRAGRRVAVLGLAFKSDTDDMRNSPAVTVVKRLLGEGCEVRVYDPVIRVSRLTGANLAYIRQNLPHFEGLLTEEPTSAFAGADVVLVNHAGAAIQEALAQVPAGARIVDAAGVMSGSSNLVEYDGPGW